MDRTRKRGQRGPGRKKRLQIDLGDSTAISTTSTEDVPPPPPQITNDETQVKDAAATTSTQSTTVGTEEASTSRPKSTSPEPNCAICLGKLENKSFTDSCFHMFCFVCLEEWSKVKAECPLCKQTFKSIIHNVRSLDDYDQYQVQRPGIAPFDIHAEMANGQRFRYRTTVTDHRYAFAHLWERERQSRLLQRPSRYMPVPNWRRMRQPANSDFRRSIYDQRMRIKQDHQVNTRRRVRETSPTFFRDNPAQTHRLVPWLNRELNALLEGHGSQVAFVLELIMGLIKRFQIGSDEVYEHLYPFIGRRTRQFMEEFLQFAKSPHMMAAYDRHVTYEPQETLPNHDSDSETEINVNREDDGNDSDVIVVSPTSEPSQTGFLPYLGAPSHAHNSLDPWERSILTAGNPTYLGFPPITRSRGHDDLTDFQSEQNPYQRLSYHVSASTSGSDSPPPSDATYRFIACGESTMSGTYTITPGRHSPSFYTRLIHDLNIPEPGPSTSAPPTVSNSQADPISCHESDTESNASDIMIVDYEKPWNERSPIRLSSAEESDCDLVITGTSYATDPIKKEHKKKKRKKSHDDRIEKAEKRKKNDEEEASTSGKHHKKRRRKSSKSPSRSGSQSYLPLEPDVGKERSRSRTNSQSPVRTTLKNYSNYLHKKYHYHHPGSSVSKRPGYRSSSFRSSGSSTDTGSDDESHISIRSRKEKSRSGHSSIEIVKYRKSKSKYKNGKKHSKSRSSDRERHSDNHSALKLKKRKKDKNAEKHKRSKKKSKSKKTKVHSKEDLDKLMRKHAHMDKSDKDALKDSHSRKVINSEEEIDPLAFINNTEKENARKEKRKKEIHVGTSDSDLDSNTDDEQTDINKAIHDYHTEDSFTDMTSESTKKDGLNAFELVELSELESAAFDKELERITRSLPVIPPEENSVINSVQLPTKSFKKHPHGHKKSTKNTQVEQVGHTLAQLSSGSSENKILDNCTKDENNIQSNDISSCTDIENRINLLIKSQDNSASSSALNLLDISADIDFLPNATNSSYNKHVSSRIYESPTSSGYRNLDIVDVETLSEGSDIDVTHVENTSLQETAIDVEGLSDTDSETCVYTNKRNDIESNQNPGENECKEEHIDVVGSSSDESDNENVIIVGSTLQSTDKVSQMCSERRLSDDDSDTTINFDIEEEHANIDITGDSDSDVSHHLEVIDSESEVDEVDVLSHINYNDGSIEIKLPLCSDSEEHDTEGARCVQFELEKECIDKKFKSSSVNNTSNNENADEENIEADVGTCTQIQVLPGNEYVKPDNENVKEDANDTELQVDKDDSSFSSLRDVTEYENVSTSDQYNDENSIGDNGATSNHVCEKVAETSDDSYHEHLNDIQNDANTSLKIVETDSPTDQIETCVKDNEPDPSENTETSERNTTLHTTTSSWNTAEASSSENQIENTPQLSLNWTLNQNFESSTFSSRMGNRSPLSPPYIATLYDRSDAELAPSPDLTFESLPQRSPRQLSPAPSVSDNEPDNFVPED